MGDGSTASGTPPQVRIYYAKQAATSLVSDLNNNGVVGGSGRHMVGVSTYSGTSASVASALSAGNSAASVNATVNGLTATGTTPFKLGMATGAADMLAGDRATFDGLDVHQVMIFLSDGKPNPDASGANLNMRPSAGEINAFKASADEVFSIAIGQGGTGSNSVDLALMASLAKPADAAHSLHVVSGSDLPAIFDAIFEQIACTPDIHVDKSASVDDLPVGGGSVTYSYEVTATGNVPLTDITVSDDKCAPVGYDSGDGNDNSTLDLDETWHYSCTTDLTEIDHQRGHRDRHVRQ